MIELPDLAVGGLAAGTLSALVLGGGLLRSRRRQTRQQAEIAALRTQLDGSVRAFTAEVEHLAGARVPAAARRITHPHLEIPGPLQPLTVGTPLGLALEKVLEALRVEVTAQRGRVDAAAQAGMRGATREIQAALYRLQDALRGLQQQYDEPELAQTLFRLDHENEQSLRRAQVTAVVCGAWVGLAREESHLVDAVTGGQARLAGYHRVAVHNHLEPGTALVSHAVEPVAIIVAELLDNALRHSAPDTDVVVGLEHVHHGVCVTIDDAGVGMTRDERERAQRFVAGDAPIHLTELGDPPRMGLAAIGRLTRQFELAVDLTSASPYGGVRAVLRIGTHLLTRLDPTRRPPSVSAPRTTRKHPESREAPGTTATASAPAAPPSPYPAASAPAAPHQTASAPRPATPAPAPAPATAPPSAARPMPPAPPTPPPSPPAPSAPSQPTPPPAPATAHPYLTTPTPDAPDDDFDFGDLPQRRRRNRTARPAPSGTTPQGPVGGQEWSSPRYPARTPEESAAALGALQSGTAAARSGRDGTAASPQDHWTATARDGSSTETLRLTPTPDWDHTPAQPIPRPPVTPDPADDWSNDDTHLDPPEDPSMDETHEWPQVAVPVPEDDTHDRPVTEGTSYDWSRVTTPPTEPETEPEAAPDPEPEFVPFSLFEPRPTPAQEPDPHPDFERTERQGGPTR
ncbi:ATP-binding protein [Streptomyces acidiscabies]|uniref:ATP-binding protein n=1 Tax=Streptomyces acidiscabies TaxID=42234 RepID=UPI000962813C|nr:ATP-binding protein [Streptomyces acidiscabies]GAV39472.1 histidine kinase-, DNA gyrase B-, and HSP90-like ATPase [Streptomyces acidiscabies]